MKAIQAYLGECKKVLVYAYIWQIPFSWRYIIDPNRGYPGAIFNEYMDISLYLGEIFLISALIIHILEYKKEEKSIHEHWKRKPSSLFHMEQMLPLVLLVFLLLNTILSDDQLLSVAFLMHIGNFAIFIYLFQRIIVPHGTKTFRDIFYILFISILFQLAIVLFQVIQGSSIGLRFLNESTLSLSMIHVAKSNIFSEVYLRGYGTFPHPNVLAGYTILFLVYLFSFHKKMFHVERIYFIFSILSAISILILTQSKLAIVLALTILAYQWFINRNTHRLFHMEHLIVIFGVLFIVGILSSALYGDIRQSYGTRIEQLVVQWSDQRVSLFGSGIGTYRKSYTNQESDWWNLEPVHFTPLIILKEIGVIGVSIVVFFLAKYFKNVPRGTLRSIMLPLLLVVFIFSVDHYAWDIYQGMFIAVFLSVLIYTIDKYRYIMHINN